MFLDDLASRIRQQRERLGLTQQALACALNVTAQAVSKWERADNAPDISLLVPLAELLEVSTDWLLAPGSPEVPDTGLRTGRFQPSPEGYGFVHLASGAGTKEDEVAADDDVYVSPSLIRRFGLKSGDAVRCSWRPARGAERFAAAVEIAEVNGRPAASFRPPAPPSIGDDQQTPRARKVMAVAREEARQFNHEFVGTEHILLALVGGGGSAAHVLVDLGVPLGRHRAERAGLMRATAEAVAPGELPLTPLAKAAVERARREAQTCGDGLVGTEHLLLGLLCQKDGVAAKVLTSFGVTVQRIGAAVHHRGD